MTQTISFNELITNWSNDNTVMLTRKTHQFLHKAYIINTKKQTAFGYWDFPGMSPNNFRQYIHKLRSVIDVVIPSRPSMYKLKKIQLSVDAEKITQRVTGDGFMSLLENLKERPAAIHDIKLMTKSDIHKSLIKYGAQINENNHGIKIGIPSQDGFIFKVMVYPKTIQVDIGCTYTPIVYDAKGMLRLISKLSYVRCVILLHASNEAMIPDVMDWIITHYHFGKDGATFEGERFHYTVENAVYGYIRYYSKTMKDGTKIPRLEQIRMPSRTLNEELEKILEISE